MGHVIFIGFFFVWGDFVIVIAIGQGKVNRFCISSIIVSSIEGTSRIIVRRIEVISVGGISGCVCVCVNWSAGANSVTELLGGGVPSLSQ